MFDEQMKIIKNQGYEFYDPKNFLNEFDKVKKSKKILITIDDGFKSFYNEAWPYLKKNKIPFILFVSTEPVGKRGYMTWDEIKEINDSDIGYIGHHSHSHEYLIDKTEKEFIKDIETATKIFKDKLGYIPSIFSSSSSACPKAKLENKNTGANKRKIFRTFRSFIHLKIIYIPPCLYIYTYIYTIIK